MKPLGEVVKRAFPGLVRQEPIRQESCDLPMPTERLTQYLVLRGWLGQDPHPVVVWINGRESCRRAHVHSDDKSVWWTKHHVYQDARGNRFALRCPATLEEYERQAIRVDDPPGSWESQLRMTRRGMLEEGRRKRRTAPAAREESGESWR